MSNPAAVSASDRKRGEVRHRVALLKSPPLSLGRSCSLPARQRHGGIAQAAGEPRSPPIVGYENQLIEWVLQDAERWKRSRPMYRPNLSSSIGKARNALLQSRLIERIDSVLPMPDAPVMLALLD